jgi:oligopeptidase A
MTNANPLDNTTDLPDYGAIRAAHAVPALSAELTRCRKLLADLLAQPAPTFATLVEPVERMHHRLARLFAPISHLNAVANSEELREAYNVCLPMLADYHAEVGQNDALYRAYEAIQKAEGPRLDGQRQRVLAYALREFRLAGVHLPPAEKSRYRELMQELATLQSRFEENVLDATQAYVRPVADESELEGLPAHVIARARDTAASRGEHGHTLQLDYPTYAAVMNHAHSAKLRRDFYAAWCTRASDQGPNAGRFDNSATMEQILAARHEAARLLGYAHYADLSLATKMAPDTPAVIGFLDELAGHYLPGARAEYAELEAYAGRSLEPWDVGYYSERLRTERFNVSEEQLRPWFPLPRVLEGMFEVARRLYGLVIRECDAVSTWHPDVRYFAVMAGDGREIGGFYGDFFARDQKRGGAWMAEVATRLRVGAASALPVANLVCNFTPPSSGEPAQLRHSDVVTLFHEFGHTLHHLLTDIDYPSLAGINGVPWDAVELPSQLMEEWAWRPEVLPLLSAHVASGEPLPAAELERLLRSRTFHAGLAAVRQLEFALFDFRLHAEHDPARGARTAEVLAAVRKRVSVLRPPAFNRFAHSFSHVFAGGYAAGYYSYKWAEVLAADAFAAFEETGVFDAATAGRFLASILSRGGECDQMEAFVRFRGRRPEVAALLRKDGLAA